MALDYDNSAFYYFALTLLSFYVFPSGWYTLKEFYAAFGPSKSSSEKARTKIELEKIEAIKSKNRGWNRLSSWSFILNFVVLLFAVSCSGYFLTQVQTNGAVNQFDPFAILQVQPDAGMKEIQKSYRKLSLQYHPDKNPGNKIAEEMFMKVARAYESLTDETARENLRKFGNPDGKQALEVSIGLPRWLLDNPKVVLVVYLLAMVVVIPVAVGLWYAQSKQYGEKNIKYESYTAFYQFISENHRIKMLPEVLASSAEFRDLSVPKQSDREGINKLLGKMKSDKLMQKPKFEHPVILKGNLLIHAHLLRITDTLTPELKNDLSAMLSISPELINAMIEISFQRRWLQTTISAIRFSQSVFQAIWNTDSPLLQLPHFTEQEIKHVVRATKNQSKILYDYLRTADDEKKGLANFSEEQKQDVFSACALIPKITVETSLFVEEEENDDDDDDEASKNAPLRTNLVDGKKIFESDVVTIRLKITRENLVEGEECSPVYAPYFPREVKESWWVLLSDRPKADPRRPGADSAQPNLHAAEKITNRSRVVTHDIKFQAPPTAGTYVMDIHLLSENYVGLDEEIEIKFTVAPASEIPEYVPHPEDVELESDPTLFEQMLTSNMDEDSSDDEDEKANAPSGNVDNAESSDDEN